MRCQIKPYIRKKNKLYNQKHLKRKTQYIKGVTYRIIHQVDWSAVPDRVSRVYNEEAGITSQPEVRILHALALKSPTEPRRIYLNVVVALCFFGLRKILSAISPTRSFINIIQGQIVRRSNC